MAIISDQRGIRQEVMLVIKRGIEAKSYEGVSPLCVANVSAPYKEFFNVSYLQISERNYLTLLYLLSFYMWLVSAMQLVK